MSKPQIHVRGMRAGYDHHRLFDDINFYVAVNSHDFYIDYVAFEVVGFDVDSGEAIFDLNLESNDVYSAPVWMHGTIKWDGCSDIYFDEQDRHMIHSCGRKSASRVGKLIDKLYDIAAELMHEKWDGDK